MVVIEDGGWGLIEMVRRWWKSKGERVRVLIKVRVRDELVVRRD